MKKINLTEEEFVLLTANTYILRNNCIEEMNKATLQEVKDFYQREIDRINALFDSINSRLKTNF